MGQAGGCLVHPQPLLAGTFSGERTLCLFQAISILWDEETKAHSEEMNRGRAGGAERPPSGSHPPNGADSSGWQEGHEAQSLERLLKDQGTDVCYWLPVPQLQNLALSS